MMARPTLVALTLLGGLWTPVVAQQADPAAEVQSEEDRAAARALAEQAHAALAAGRAADAIELYDKALELAPEERRLHYDRGVALEREGRTDEARQSYESVLRGLNDEVERRALFNLGGLGLDDAAAASELLRDVLASELTTDQQVQVARETGKQALESADRAVDRLRDLLRRDPTEADVAHNLELGQRHRRQLRELLDALPPPEGQSSPSDDRESEDDAENSEGEDQGQEQDGRSDEQGQEGETPEQTPDSGAAEDGDEGEQGEQEPQPEAPQPNPEEGAQQDSESSESGDEGESPSEAGSSSDEPRPQPETGREEAERRLEGLLEQARERAEKVRELRRERSRKTPVERDW